MFGIQREANVKCRAISIEGKIKPLEKWNDDDSMEWQANYFSSALLMPKSMVMQMCNDKKLINQLEYESLGITVIFNNLLVVKVAEIFNVSFKAAEVRLSNLNLLRKENSTKQELFSSANMRSLINAI